MAFKIELQNKLRNYGAVTEYEIFQSIFMDTLNKHASMKEKHIRANNAPFMNKTLHKAIMTRSRYKNKFLKNPNTFNRVKYKKHR